MYVLVDIKGKQYKAEKGSTLQVDKLENEKGDSLEFDKVLMVGGTEDVKEGLLPLPVERQPDGDGQNQGERRVNLEGAGLEHLHQGFVPGPLG